MKTPSSSSPDRRGTQAALVVAVVAACVLTSADDGAAQLLPAPTDDHTQAQPAPTDDREQAQPASTDDTAQAPTSSGEAPRTAAPCDTPPPGFACIPGGWFVRGVDVDDHACRQSGQPHDREPATVPASRVWVDTFYMALTETTNCAFSHCVEQDRCDRDAGPSYRDFDAPGQPITGVSWHDANDYCHHVGGHLPTEAEWELAARGPDGDLYPWGNAPATCDLAVIRDDSGRSCGTLRRGSTPETGRVLEPCTRGPHRYGLCDMVGNAEEWTADAWTEDWADCGAPCTTPNPQGPCNGAEPCDDHPYRVVRGGSWYWPAEHATAPHRRRHYPANNPFHHFGFRCAMSTEEAGRPGALPQTPQGN